MNLHGNRAHKILTEAIKSFSNDFRKFFSEAIKFWNQTSREQLKFTKKQFNQMVAQFERDYHGNEQLQIPDFLVSFAKHLTDQSAKPTSRPTRMKKGAGKTVQRHRHGERAFA